MSNTTTLPDGRLIKFSIKAKATGFYNVCFRGPDKRLERGTGCTTQKAATIQASVVIRETYCPKAPEPKAEEAPKMTWVEATQKMKSKAEAQNLRPRTIDDYEMILRQLERKFPNPESITEAEAMAYIEKRMETKSASTVAGNLNKCQIIWHKYLQLESPWSNIQPPKVDQKTPRFITPIEKANFFDWLRTKWSGWELPTLFFEVKAEIGCRLSELCNLPTDALRMSEGDGWIHFSAETTKGRKDRDAFIPLPLFAKLKAIAGPNFVWENFPIQLAQRLKLKAHKKCVQKFDPRRLKRWLQNQKTIFEKETQCKPFHIHNFRGTAMSEARMSGVNESDGAEMFGCNVATMQKHYLAVDRKAIAKEAHKKISAWKAKLNKQQETA